MWRPGFTDRLFDGIVQCLVQRLELSYSSALAASGILSDIRKCKALQELYRNFAIAALGCPECWDCFLADNLKTGTVSIYFDTAPSLRDAFLHNDDPIIILPNYYPTQVLQVGLSSSCLFFPHTRKHAFEGQALRE